MPAISVVWISKLSNDRDFKIGTLYSGGHKSKREEIKTLNTMDTNMLLGKSVFPNSIHFYDLPFF